MKKNYLILMALMILIVIASCKKDNNLKDVNEQEERTETYFLKNGAQVTVFINKHGEYILMGDIILSKNQIAYLEQNRVSTKVKTNPRSTFDFSWQKHWPGGIIYFTITDVSNSAAINIAINHWEANTPIRFVQRTTQSNYVDFAGQPTQGGGSSQLGMVGGRQEIRLLSNSSPTTVIHEIGHAVGLVHEQNRFDRDNYININYNNIQGSWTSQYAVYSWSYPSYFGPFDYESVMIYPSYAGGPGNPAYPGNTTPQMTKKSDGSTWNQGSVLSTGDIEGVNFLYLKNPNGLPYARIEVENMQATDDGLYTEKGDFYIAFYTNYDYTTRVIPPSSIVFNYTRQLTFANYFQGSSYIFSTHTIQNTGGLNRIYIGTFSYRGVRAEEDPQWGNFDTTYTFDFYVEDGQGYNKQAFGDITYGPIY